MKVRWGRNRRIRVSGVVGVRKDPLPLVCRKPTHHSTGVPLRRVPVWDGRDVKDCVTEGEKGGSVGRRIEGWRGGVRVEV